MFFSYQYPDALGGLSGHQHSTFLETVLKLRAIREQSLLWTVTYDLFSVI